MHVQTIVSSFRHFSLFHWDASAKTKIKNKENVKKNLEVEIYLDVTWCQ